MGKEESVIYCYATSGVFIKSFRDMFPELSFTFYMILYEFN